MADRRLPRVPSGLGRACREPSPVAGELPGDDRGRLEATGPEF